jgi:hypothetical protein
MLRKFDEFIVDVYQVQSMEYRAYVKGNANLEAWGITHNNALKNLFKHLLKVNFITEIPEWILNLENY